MWYGLIILDTLNIVNSGVSLYQIFQYSTCYLIVELVISKNGFKGEQMTQQIIKMVEEYYNSKILSHGPTPKGVDWNGLQSQEVRLSSF